MKNIRYAIAVPLASLIALALVYQGLKPRRSFRTVLAAPELGNFYDSGQLLGSGQSWGVAVGDLDADSDLDAVVANKGLTAPDTVWLNNGFATFTASGQNLGTSSSQDVALADLDGDGDLDAFVAHGDDPVPGANTVWLNDGSGTFSSTGQALGSADSRAVALADLDGDGDTDAYAANAITDTVWLNDGTGMFTTTGQTLDTRSGRDVVLADLDGDNDPDAFVANGSSLNEPSAVWWNNGDGTFVDSGQTLAPVWTYGVALGDLDGDLDLDAYFANWFPNANLVFINNGSGIFTDSGQALGAEASLGVSLADVDKDGDLDAVVANNTPAAGKIWLNDGSGTFTESAQAVGGTTTGYDIGIGDLDADLDPDLFLGLFNANQVWLNGTPGLPGAFFDVERTINDLGDDVYYKATTGDAMLPFMLGRPMTQTVEAHARVETSAGAITQTLPFAPGEQIRFLNIVNPTPNPNEALTLTLSLTFQGIPPSPADKTDRLLLVFVDGSQGLAECILCYLEWLGRFMGFNPVFGALHHLNLPALEGTLQWAYYTSLYDLYAPEMAAIAASSPSILWMSLETFDELTPAAESLEAGTGDTFILTQGMVDGAIELTEAVKASASPGLQAALQHEQAALDLPSLAGLSVEEVWDEIVLRRPISEMYATVVIKE